MKWTDLILPGIILYAAFKTTKQPTTPQAYTAIPFGLSSIDAGMKYQLLQSAPRTSSMALNSINKQTQPSNPQLKISSTPIGLSNYEITEIVQKAIKEASQNFWLPSMSVSTSKKELAEPDKNTIEAGKWLEIVKHPSEVVILGRRGSGKSSLAYRVAEHLKDIAPVYVVAFPNAAKKYLPPWIGVVPRLEELPNYCIAIVDEAYITYHARSSMTTAAKEMSGLINLSRQKNQTIIFVSQESRQIDRNILSGADVIVFKEPSLLQTHFDRPELRKITEEAREAFQNITGDLRKWAYVITQNRRDILVVESSLPTFWTNQLSHAFSCAGESSLCLAKQPGLTERIAKAKQYDQQGLSLRQIGKHLGVSASTVKNYLDGYPYNKGS